MKGYGVEYFAEYHDQTRDLERYSISVESRLIEGQEMS